MKKKFLNAFLEGIKDGLEQGVLQSGITWSDGDDLDYDVLNECYDHGANVGEALSTVKREIKLLVTTAREGLRYVYHS